MALSHEERKEGKKGHRQAGGGGRSSLAGWLTWPPLHRVPESGCFEVQKAKLLRASKAIFNSANY